MTDSLLILTIMFCLGYIILIGIFTTGWFRIPAFRVEEHSFPFSLTVIVAIRNEARRIGLLINDLHQQETSIVHEIIIVDDHSEDETTQIVEEFLNKHPGHHFRLIRQEPGLSGKKAAITTGVRLSNGALILTTDGDCRMGPRWIHTMASFYAIKGYRLISGPVVYEHNKGMASIFHSLEFLSLVGTGAGAIGAGFPVMCNGANLAFEKKAYENTLEDHNSRRHVSGDDVFLLHAIKTRYGPKQIGFIKSHNAIVSTEPPRTLPDFINQRIRWVSKSSKYTDPMTVTTALVIFVFNLFIMAFLISGFFYSVFLIPFLIMFAVKMLTDIPVLAGITTFSGRQKLLWYYLPVQIVYVPFIIISGIAGHFSGFRWKGRKK